MKKQLTILTVLSLMSFSAYSRLASFRIINTSGRTIVAKINHNPNDFSAEGQIRIHNTGSYDFKDVDRLHIWTDTNHSWTWDFACVSGDWRAHYGGNGRLYNILGHSWIGTR